MTTFLNALSQQSLATLFRLWQQHRLTLQFYPPCLLIEKVVVHATLEIDQATSIEVEEVLGLFNALAGTQYQIQEVLAQRHINHGHSERQGQLEVKAQRLWWLDFGDVDFPLYAITQEEAERVASIIEQGREKRRLSLELQEQRREDYSPVLVVCNFVVARMSKAEALS